MARRKKTAGELDPATGALPVSVVISDNPRLSPTQSPDGENQRERLAAIIARHRNAELNVKLAEINWLTIDEAAEYLSHDKGYICRLADAGRLVDNGKQRKGRRISRASVQKYEQDRVTVAKLRIP